MKAKSIIVDLDGTITNCIHRLRYIDGSQRKDWPRFYAEAINDSPYDWCVEMVREMHASGHEIIFLTAREGTTANENIARQWLDMFVGVPYKLLMRRAKDFRKDFIVKQEIYQTLVAPFYDVVLAVDDKPEVCNMYRAMGLNVQEANVP